MSDVRVARMSDEPQLRGAALELLGEYVVLPDGWPGGLPDPLPPALGDAVAKFPETAVPPDGEVLVALAGDAPVGVIQLMRHDERSVTMRRLYVRPGHEGRGIGAALVAESLRVAVERGYDAAVLTVLPWRETAARLYERFGFRPVDPFDHFGIELIWLGRELADLR